METASIRRRFFASSKNTSYLKRFTPVQAMLTLLIFAVLTLGIAGGITVFNRARALAPQQSTPATTEVQPLTVTASSTTESQPSSTTAPAANPRTPSLAAAQPTLPACQKAAIVQPSGAPLAQPGVNQVTEAPQYYQVYGSTLQQIRSQLRSCAPNGYFASTNYRLNWSFKSQILSSGQCQISDVRVGMHVIVQYPSWQPDQQANAATRQQWNTMMQNLVTHEQGHVSRNTQVANELVSSLQSLPPTDCSIISAQVQTVTSQYVTKLRAAHSSYDSATNHGHTQGASL